MAKKKHPAAILEGEVANFETLQRAAADGNLALMSTKDAKTGARVIAICAVYQDPPGTYNMVPLAKLFAGNPYEELIPPGDAA